jgi:hypothetical protein
MLTTLVADASAPYSSLARYLIYIRLSGDQQAEYGPQQTWHPPQLNNPQLIAEFRLGAGHAMGVEELIVCAATQ